MNPKIQEILDTMDAVLARGHWCSARSACRMAGYPMHVLANAKSRPDYDARAVDRRLEAMRRARENGAEEERPGETNETRETVEEPAAEPDEAIDAVDVAAHVFSALRGLEKPEITRVLRASALMFDVTL